MNTDKHTFHEKSVSICALSRLCPRIPTALCRTIELVLERDEPRDADLACATRDVS